MPRRYLILSLTGVVGLCLLSVLAYNLPPIQDHLGWRVDSLRAQVKRFFNPPEEVVFVPQEQVDAIVNATMTALAPTTTPTPALTETALPSPTASLVPTPIPASVSLSGIHHEYQQFN
ncbi:MAG TPA: hypothetical protein VFH34_08770, partial [Anaerolineales bacterium]|nr:hypothetical protein [Anaerolineales bacterium]